MSSFHRLVQSINIQVLILVIVAVVGRIVVIKSRRCTRQVTDESANLFQNSSTKVRCGIIRA